MARLEPTRDLRLIRLPGPGLKRLGVTHAELIESSSAQYPRTAAWAQALHDANSGADGMVWMSRQDNDARALVLWADRVDRFNDLRPSSSTPPQSLYLGAGYDKVLALADELAITVVA